MKIELLEESGYHNALLGMSLSYYDHKDPIGDWWNSEKFARAERRAKTLAHNQGGHNKFLESISVTLFIQASRSFWSEFDTYRVGTTKQSASTMHTLDKRLTDIGDYEVGTSYTTVDAFNFCLVQYKDPESEYYKDITRLKNNLPEGWLQERVVVTNYKVIQNIYNQRHNHRLKYWKQFCEFLIANIEHPEFIVKEV